MKILMYLILALTVLSCSDPEIRKLKGNWTIDLIEEKEQDIMFQFTSNLITFKNNKDCIVPQSRENNNTKGKWKFIKENEKYYLEIKIKGNKFAGKYRIDFKNDNETKLLKMFLLSDDKRIICSKLLNNFND